MASKQSGFTLIELMIVVAIVAILASIAVPSYKNQVAKGKIKEAQSNLISISLYAQNYYQRKLSYPNGDLTHTAFSKWSASSSDFSYTYSSTGADYTITATGVDSKVSGCVLTLKDNGDRDTNNNCSNITSW